MTELLVSPPWLEERLDDPAVRIVVSKIEKKGKINRRVAIELLD